MSQEREEDRLTRGVLGKTPGTLKVSTSVENNRVTLTLARQARFSLDILSRSLDPPVYDGPELADAVKRVALEYRRARIRFLIQDPERVVRFGHRLLVLATHLSSFIEMRVPSEEFMGIEASWLTADDRGYVYRDSADSYEGVASFCDPAVTRQYRREFDKIWETALPDPNLRQLKI